MGNETLSVLLERDKLLLVLQTCVDEVFDKMIGSVGGATVTRVEYPNPSGVRAAAGSMAAGTSRPEAVYKQVVVGFSGAATGRVVISCSLDSVDTIARGLLMMDDTEVHDLDAVHDALGECANMLAGALKTKALDPLGDFQLGLPQFIEPEAESIVDGALVYRVESGVMSVELWLSGQVGLS